MSIDMVKKAAEVSLVKHMQKSLDQGNDPGEIEVQVEVYVDTSTSMWDRYSLGDSGRRTPQVKKGLFGRHKDAPAPAPAPAPASEMQTTVTRDLALTLTGLDKDQQIPLYAFDYDVREIGTVTEDNYKTILADWLASNQLVSATCYMPIVRRVASGAPADPKNDSPRVIIVHTDGTPTDADRFRRALIGRSDQPEFWIIVGHGHSLNFVRELDNMKDENGQDPRAVDNVALVELDNAADKTDEEYFDMLVDELITKWFPAIRAKGITNK